MQTPIQLQRHAFVIGEGAVEQVSTWGPMALVASRSLVSECSKGAVEQVSTWGPMALVASRSLVSIDETNFLLKNKKFLIVYPGKPCSNKDLHSHVKLRTKAEAEVLVAQQQNEEVWVNSDDETEKVSATSESEDSSSDDESEDGNSSSDDASGVLKPVVLPFMY
jgi:hypothetical protein